MSNQFSRKKINFHDRVLPEEGILIGYGWLLQIIEDTRNRRLPLPERLAIITEKQQRYNTPQWQVFAKRYMPEDSAIGHLTFALKYEGLDLLILKEFFLAVGDTPVMSMMQNEPTGQYSRRIWFL